MKLSVIVVNHNKCEMLRHTLNSLIDAGKNIDYEIFMVDNFSTDKSVEMVKSEFPDSHVIVNGRNEGSAHSYNEAVNLAKGEYILLVTPDIISSKKTLERSLEFMDLHTDSGGLGVRMINPQGRFLPESNRGLTQSWITFFKLTGLAKLFPKSRLSDRNRKDWVEEFQTSEVDFINGSFMLVRKSAFNEVGLFDERFFTYGHDIDMSYRLRLAGYKNYYFPKTYIIKYSDSSIAKFNWQFIKNFYGAMIIFAMKYLFRLPEIKVAGIPQPQLPLIYEIER